jgi:hypothetical protein
MTNTFEQQKDLFNSCNILENCQEYSYIHNETNSATVVTKYYDNNTTLPSINFPSYTNAFGYFKGLTSLIADKCPFFSMYSKLLAFNTTNSFVEIASNLTSPLYYYSSEDKFCTLMYRRVGIEMSSYVCNSEKVLDDYYANFSNNLKHIHNAEIAGETTAECNSN